jgi:hypothetical protein
MLRIQPDSFWQNTVLAFRRQAGKAREGMPDYFSAPAPCGKKEHYPDLIIALCGIDIHKDSVTICVLLYSGQPEPEVRKTEFAIYFKALLNLKMWPLSQKVTHVAMESTGVYWKPVWQALV